METLIYILLGTLCFISAAASITEMILYVKASRVIKEQATKLKEFGADNKKLADNNLRLMNNNLRLMNENEKLKKFEKDANEVIDYKNTIIELYDDNAQLVGSLLKPVKANVSAVESSRKAITKLYCDINEVPKPKLEVIEFVKRKKE